ncbi:MAG TPA: Ig-like domain-containing protein, partial [Verrucomicrobiae bacterium]|nr:Ig-like domain-containing protein [Verrucomicrobiae bacterium]
MNSILRKIFFRPEKWGGRITLALALAWFLTATSRAAAGLGSLDSDADGLPDADEINIYGTDPNKADTDGDGQSDGNEVRAGTDPRSKASSFRILGSPTSLSLGGWRVQWSSVPGKEYHLMRWNGEDLATPGNPRWVMVASVRATGAVAQADDPAVGQMRRYYRVALVESTDGEQTDHTPPVVGTVQTNPAAAEAEGIVTLMVTAQDTNKVAGVTFYDGVTALGAGIQTDEEMWRFNWPVTFDLNGTRSLTAQAVDPAGNRATSAPVLFKISIANPQMGKTL